MPADEPPRRDEAGGLTMEALLGGAVLPDASAVQLDFLAANGGGATLTLPAHLVARTMVSLLALLAELQRRSADGADDIVHPVGSWRLDASTAPGQALLTITTTERVRLPLLIRHDDLAVLAGATQRLLQAGRETRH